MKHIPAILLTLCTIALFGCNLQPERREPPAYMPLLEDRIRQYWIDKTHTSLLHHISVTHPDIVVQRLAGPSKPAKDCLSRLYLQSYSALSTPADPASRYEPGASPTPAPTKDPRSTRRPSLTSCLFAAYSHRTFEQWRELPDASKYSHISQLLVAVWRLHSTADYLTTVVPPGYDNVRTITGIRDEFQHCRDFLRDPENVDRYLDATTPVAIAEQFQQDIANMITCRADVEFAAFQTRTPPEDRPVSTPVQSAIDLPPEPIFMTKHDHSDPQSVPEDHDDPVFAPHTHEGAIQPHVPHQSDHDHTHPRITITP